MLQKIASYLATLLNAFFVGYAFSSVEPEHRVLLTVLAIVYILSLFYIGTHIRKSLRQLDKVDGRFVFDTSNPNKDTITIEYEEPPLSLASKDVVIFKVENE